MYNRKPTTLLVVTPDFQAYVQLSVKVSDSRISYMLKMSEAEIIKHCRKKGWTTKVVEDYEEGSQ